MQEFPELIKLKERFNNTSLNDYVLEHLLKERELLPFDESAYKTFSKNFSAKNVRRICTGSHMGFVQWEEPFALGENVLNNLPSLLGEGEQNVTVPYSRITFASAVRDSRPGSVDLTNMGPVGRKLSRYVLRGRSKITLDKAEKISDNEVEEFLRNFHKLESQPTMFPFVNPSKLKKFIQLVKDCTRNGQSFNSQSSYLSSNLWSELFSDLKVKPLNMHPMEDLNLVRENPLENTALRELFETSFKDTYGATNSTYFYYGSCKCGREFPLKKHVDGSNVYLSGKCVDTDCVYFGKEEYSVHVKDIVEEIKNKNLNETLLFSFYNIWALAGIDVIGGFVQIHYLKDFKDKLIQIYKKSGDQKRVDILEKRATNLFGTGILVSFNPDGTPKPGLAALLEGGFDKKYLENISALKFGRTIDATLGIIESVFSKKADYSKVLELLKENKMEFMIK
ncbi:hypothetical protein HY988_04500 [Candidatus Micrarchaeota archaeon]|nr:hypothetical protein [Candidatus Micrarchaeota archaeon]